MIAIAVGGGIKDGVKVGECELWGCAPATESVQIGSGFKVGIVGLFMALLSTLLLTKATVVKARTDSHSKSTSILVSLSKESQETANAMHNGVQTPQFLNGSAVIATAQPVMSESDASKARVKASCQVLKIGTVVCCC